MPVLPPYAALIGATLDPVDPQAVVMPFGPAVIGRPGFLHGGAIAGLLEMAAFVAITRALAGEGDDAAGTRIKPINVAVDYLRGGRDHPTRAAGTIVRLGRRIANVDAVAWQEARDRPVATARLTYLLERPGSPTRA